MSRTNIEPKLRIWKTIPREHLADFKVECQRIINEQELTQEEIASACGVHPSTVSRWFDVDGDLQFPLALIPSLGSETLLPLAQGMLQYVASHIDLIVTRKIPITGTLNASIKDETLNIVEQVGSLAAIARTDGRIDAAKRRESKLMLVKIMETAQQGIREIEEMEG